MSGPEALVCPGPYGCSPLAPCPPSPGPRSDGPTPGSYGARCPMPMLRVLGSSVNMGTRTPTVPPRHRPGRRGLPAGEQGTPRGSPRLTFCEIYRPVSLLDGGVELAPLAGQLVHPAPQGSYLDGGQDADLRPSVARQPVRCRAHEGLEGSVTQRQGIAARQGVR